MIGLLDVAFGLTAAGWTGLAGVALRGSAALPDLEPLDRGGTERTTPARVRAVVAARDDADAIEATIRGLLAQRDVDLEVVAVDDRSRDATPDRLAALAATDPRLIVRRVEELPEDWLGKCHACWTGAAGTDADWLLFVDADTRLRTEHVVARAIRTATRAGAAHVPVVPDLRGQSLAGRAVSLAMCLGLAVQAFGLAIGRRPMGVGAFNLVRTDAYFAVDGHRRLRMEVLEDVGLGAILQSAGHRTALRMAPEDVDVEWITTAGSVFRVLEKNWFAIFRFRPAEFLGVWGLIATGWAVGLAGPFVSTAGWLATAGLAATALPAVACARRYRWHPALALATPLAFGWILAGMAWSFWRTMSRGGVSWRDTWYPLDALRRGVVRG